VFKEDGGRKKILIEKMKNGRRPNHISAEDELFLGYSPEVLAQMWGQAFPVLSDKTAGKPIIIGTSGEIDGTNLEEFYNHE
jgi:hypothetical protein